MRDATECASPVTFWSRLRASEAPSRCSKQGSKARVKLCLNCVNIQKRTFTHILELCVLSDPPLSERNFTNVLEPCLGLNKQTAELQTRLQHVSKVLLQIRRKLEGQTQSKRNFTQVLDSCLVLRGGVSDANRRLQKVGGVMHACMYVCTFQGSLQSTPRLHALTLPFFQCLGPHELYSST